MRETVFVLPKNQENGRGRDPDIIYAEEHIINRVEGDPSASMREITREVYSHWIVLRTLQESLLYPYYLQRV